jgi:hypothetical protein
VDQISVQATLVEISLSLDIISTRQCCTTAFVR